MTAARPSARVRALAAKRALSAATAAILGLTTVQVATVQVVALTPAISVAGESDAPAPLPSKTVRTSTGGMVTVRLDLPPDIDPDTLSFDKPTPESPNLTRAVTVVDLKHRPLHRWTIDSEQGTITVEAFEGFTRSPGSLSYTARTIRGVEAPEGTITVVAPQQRTVDSLSAAEPDADQRSRTFLGADGMFPDLPDWNSTAYTLDGADENGRIVRQGVGTFYIDSAASSTSSAEGGRVVFDPEPHYTGKPDPVTLVATTRLDHVLKAQYQPVVYEQRDTFSLPDAAATGVPGEAVAVTPGYKGYVDKQTLALEHADAGSSGRIRTVPKQGVWSIGGAGEFTFAPVAGFIGNPDPVTYTARNSVGTPASRGGTVTVTYPEQRTVAATSTGRPGEAQSTQLSAMFPDIPASAKPTFRLGKNDGAFLLIDDHVRFTPEPSFTGTAQPVRVIAETVNGDRLESTYTPTVTPVAVTSETVTSFPAVGIVDPDEEEPTTVTATATVTPDPVTVTPSPITTTVVQKAEPQVVAVTPPATTVTQQPITTTVTLPRESTTVVLTVQPEPVTVTPAPVTSTVPGGTATLTVALTPTPVTVTQQPVALTSTAAVGPTSAESADSMHIGAEQGAPIVVKLDKPGYTPLRFSAIDGKKTRLTNNGTRLLIDGEGTWSITDGRVVFDPEPDFLGELTPVQVVFATPQGRVPFTLTGSYGPRGDRGTGAPGQPGQPGAGDGQLGAAQADGSSSGAGRCFGNAVRSPIAWLIPLGLLGVAASGVAQPLMAEYQKQLEPPVVAVGVVAAIAALAGLLYDWCSAEPGQAATAIGPGGSASQ